MKSLTPSVALAALVSVTFACETAAPGGKPSGQPAEVASQPSSGGSGIRVVTEITERTGQTISVLNGNETRPIARPTSSCAREGTPRWTPPAGLESELARAASVLLDLGLPSPAGLRLVRARAFNGRFEGDDTATPTLGWLVPARDGASAMLLSLRGDLVEFEGEPTPVPQLDPHSVSPTSDWTSMRRARARGTVQHSYIAAALMALSGDARGANALWSALRPTDQSKSYTAVLEFAELYFDSALAAFRAGRHGPAQLMLRSLECARPFIEEHCNSLRSTTTFEGGSPRTTEERSTEFLALVPPLAEEVRRRSAERRAPIAQAQLATAPVAELIASLETVEIQWDRGDVVENEPVLRALRARGAPAVSDLIDAFERDARWTRTVEHQSYPLGRNVVTVRTVLGWIISEITGIYAEEFGWTSFVDDDAPPREVARALRERWNIVRAQSPFDRALAALTDTSSNFSRQIYSVAWLFRPLEGQQSSVVLMRGARPSVIDRFIIEGPALTSAQRERLVQALRLRAPGLAPLRDRSAATIAEEDRRCAYAQMMYLASPALAAPFVRETLEREYARRPTLISPGCTAWLSGALVANGDRDPAIEVARRIRTMNSVDGELRTLGGWWSSLAAQSAALPMWEALAANIADAREWPVQTDAGRTESLVAPGALSAVSRKTINVRAVREAVLRLLDDQRLNSIIRFDRSATDAQYLNARGMHTISFSSPAEGPEFVAPNTASRLRLADAVADYLVAEHVIEPAHTFDIRWTLARRDQAITAIKAALRAMP